MTSRIVAMAAILAGGSLATAASRQAVFRSRTDVVVIDAAVSDGRKPVTHLTRDDFELRDNGVVQSILEFSHGKLPLDVTLTIDISGSMTRQKRAAVARAVAQVSGALNATDRGAVVTFGLRVAERVPLRHPPITVDLSATGRGTSILDALLLCLVTAPSPDRRQLNVFMTDGDDTTSFFDERTVLETARHAPGQMSFVLTRGGGTNADRQILTVFQSIARATGGEIIQIDQDDFLSAAFLAAIENFRTSYVLRYSPTGVPQPGWHEVSVTVKRKNYSVRARRGYWADPATPLRSP
jgi:Mg-chelatase subunit ChlD